MSFGMFIDFLVGVAGIGKVAKGNGSLLTSLLTRRSVSDSSDFLKEILSDKKAGSYLLANFLNNSPSPWLGIWWGWLGLNQRPTGYEPAALTAELHPHGQTYYNLN